MCKTKWVTSLDHCAKQRLGLTETQYCVADLIYQLSHNPNSYDLGWCNAKRDTMAAMLQVSKPTLYRALAALKELGLIESKGQRLRTTKEWWNNTVGYKQPTSENKQEQDESEALAIRDKEIEALKAEIEALKAAIGSGRNPEESKAGASAKRSALTDSVIDYLNHRTQSDFKKMSRASLKAINARIKEGMTLDDLKSVIDFKVKDWGNDSTMSQYLRPETLFGAKCESYLNAAKRENNNPRSTTSKRRNESDVDFETVLSWASGVDI